MKRPITLTGQDRTAFYRQWNEQGFTAGCEVGVYKGENARAMLEHIPELRLLLVDAYRPYSYMRNKSKQRWKWDQGSMDRVRSIALKRLASSNVHWIMLPSALASRCIEDDSLDFVYIDSDHRFDYIMHDLFEWAPKVRTGGSISGHDYGISSVQKAVNLYAERHGYQIVITDRQLEKRRSRTTVSWMMTKE